MLQVNGLEKAFDGRTVVRRVDLDVRSAEAVALVGANGSGKTTTLRSIVGLTIPDRGVILIDGVDALRRPRDARRLMSYMSQRPAFPDTLTAREVLNVVSRLRGVGASRVDEEIAACGLDAVAGHRVADLSGGERQRVALAAALLPDVRLYLFDEPSASLDAAGIAILICRVAALRRNGRAVLFTTHVATDLDALATRVERIEDGRCVAARTANEAAGEAASEAAEEAERNDDAVHARRGGCLPAHAAARRVCGPLARA